MSESTTKQTESVTKRFTEGDVTVFSYLSEDANPVHLDEEYAKETRFGTRIVHGSLVASLISSALARFDGTVIYAGQDLRFLAPVEIGETVTATATVVSEEDAYKTVSTVVTNQDGDEVIVGEATIVVDQ